MKLDVRELYIVRDELCSECQETVKFATEHAKLALMELGARGNRCTGTSHGLALLGYLIACAEDYIDLCVTQTLTTFSAKMEDSPNA